MAFYKHKNYCCSMCVRGCTLDLWNGWQLCGRLHMSNDLSYKGNRKMLAGCSKLPFPFVFSEAKQPLLRMLA